MTGISGSRADWILGFPGGAKPRLLPLMNETESLAENILLIGIMGCGKSTVGRELQQRLGYPLVDMDQEIERMAGKPITAIFADEGEERFRGRRIISTGGGVIGCEENRRLLRDLGYVVWLDAPLAVILERTGKSRHRPLLHTDDPAAKIRELMERRGPLYQETAHLKLDTAGLDSGEIATGILECARYFFTHRQ
jgi:shikimate kinase